MKTGTGKGNPSNVKGKKWRINAPGRKVLSDLKRSLTDEQVIDIIENGRNRKYGDGFTLKMMKKHKVGRKTIYLAMNKTTSYSQLLYTK